MSDHYQPVYDAVCARIGHPDISGVVERVCREAFDVSWQRGQLAGAISGIESDMRRPFVLLRPKMFIDGNQWCALYGENLQDGVAGFGDTPDAASWSFDIAWNESRIALANAKAVQP